MPKGKVIAVNVTPYHILDVMADPDYMPLFIRRYNIGMEKAIAKRTTRPYWSVVYKDDPKLLHEDCMDEIRRILGMQETSASSVRFTGMVKEIVMNAASDWITQKTGRTPEFEIFPNTVKSATINMNYYGPYIAEQKRKKERETAEAAASTTLNLGDPGASSVREELDRGDGLDELL